MSTGTAVAGERTTATRSPNRHHGRRSRSDLRTACLFIGPAMLGFVVFYLFPTIRGAYLSLTEYSLLGDPEWVGLQNYRDILADDLFWNAMKVTVEYVALNIGFQTVLALGLAILMHRVARSTLIRGALLLPYFVANVIVALLWFWLLDYQIGIANELLEWLGISRVAFFGSETWAIPTIAFVNTWRHMG